MKNPNPTYWTKEQWGKLESEMKDTNNQADLACDLLIYLGLVEPEPEDFDSNGNLNIQ
jgi:hypothetical protein